MLEFLYNTTTTSISIIDAIITIIVAFIAGGIISVTYMNTHNKYSQNFALTVVLLPAVISIIIMLIGSDVAKAFSLAGAFSIIRFRSAPGDPKDIAYVLFSMAAGLATGAGEIVYALLFTIILCLFMVILDKTAFGFKKNTRKRLQITIPEDLDYDNLFDEVMKDFTKSYELKEVKTTALGSLFTLTYEISLIDDRNAKAFIDALRCRNGNLNIKLSQVIEQSAY